MCADHTLCMACMACSHHPNHTFDTVTTPCRWHVDRQRGRREGGSSLIPSNVQVAHTTTPHLPSFPPFPLLISLPSPTTHSHTIISTDLADNHLHITATLTHTSQSSPNACASAEETQQQQQQQQPHYSCSSPSPAAQVLLHLHATHAHTSNKWYMCE